MRTLILMVAILSPTLSFAGEVLYVEPDGITNKQVITYDDDVSFLKASGKDFHNFPEYKFSNKTVYASNFSQEIPDSDIFAEDTENVTFVQCNLDNVKLPDGSAVIGGSQRSFKVQNDLRDWEVDDRDKPVKLVNEDYWKSRGFSVNPEDIPAQKITKVDDAPKADVINP